jgi:CRP-like cAMP-binding protein
MASLNPAAANLLKAVPLFSLVEPQEMQELVPLLQAVQLQAGQVLFRERTPGEGMWILGEGAEVSISQTRGARPVVIATDRTGETVGEMALIDGGPRSGAAVVTQAGPAYYIAALDFQRLREAYRPAAFKVLRQICRELCFRLRATSDRVAPAHPGAVPAASRIPSQRHATDAEIGQFAPFEALPRVVKLALSQKLQQIEIAASQPIFSEGDQGEEAYFVLSGQVSVKRSGRTLHQLGPGAMFGLVSVIDEGRRSASAVAERPARLLRLLKSDFDALFVSGNRFAFQMVDLVSVQLVGRLRATNELVSGAEGSPAAAGGLPGARGGDRLELEMLPLELELELSLDEAFPA